MLDILVLLSDSFDTARSMPSSQVVIRLRGYDDTGSSMTICFRIFRRYISKATLNSGPKTKKRETRKTG